MGTLTRLVSLAVLFLPISACSSPEGKKDSKSGRAPRTTTAVAGQEGDFVRLKNGEVIQGRLVASTDRGVVIDTSQGRRYVMGGAILDYNDAHSQKESALSKLRPSANEEAAKSWTPQASSWYPRARRDEPVKHFVISWFDDHPFAGKGSCVGEFAGVLKEIPELVLFSGQEGAKVILKDSRGWGWHSHALPGDRMSIPKGKEGLTIAIGVPSRTSSRSSSWAPSPLPQAVTRRDSPARYSLPIIRIRERGLADGPGVTLADPLAGDAEEEAIGEVARVVGADPELALGLAPQEPELAALLLCLRVVDVVDRRPVVREAPPELDPPAQAVLVLSPAAERRQERDPCESHRSTSRFILPCGV